MRVILLSIAFLFIAFSAQSQVLKSAGVWYFLDVDSMTARPAVLPNGTELAYVVGTKTVYYWNRNTSTWMAYGSTFSRDSIYFDASIVGSGTVSDPWGVDSTLFATIAGVGDSIAAALGDYLPILGGRLTGTGGNGFVGFPLQSSPPATPATGFSLYAGSTGNNISWMQPDGFFRRLVSPVTGTPRQYQFMARSYTLADSADIANNVTSIAANYLATSNGTNLVARNLFDNNTYVGVLNSKPFSLGQWATAGRPSGTSGYMGWNTTLTGIDWYNGTRWATGLESTFARGTATYVPFFDANGQVTENVNFQTKSSTGQYLSKYSNAGALTTPAYSFQGDEDTGIAGSTDGVAIIHNGTKVIDFRSTSINVLTSMNFFGAPNLGSVTSTIGRIFANEYYAKISSATASGYSFHDNLNRFVGGMWATGTGANHFIGISTKLTADASPVNRFYIGASGFIGIGNSFTTPSYTLHVSATDGFGLPRGTVAQRPTIVASTTPFRYNTDSTALEYGESVGTWRQIATRTYVRSLVAGATWLKPQLEAGNVTINALSNADFVINNLDTTKFGNVLIRGRSSSLLFINPNVGSSGTLSEGSGFHTNLNGTITGSDGGTGHIVVGGVVTANTSGANFNVNVGYTNNTSGAYASAFGYNADATADNTLAIGRNSVSDEAGEISIGSSNYTKLNLNASGTAGQIVATNYGAGNKEAADLSKTISAYAAIYATDGTLLEYPLADLGGANSSILDSLPNGSIILNARGNSLEIDSLSSLLLQTSTGENLYLDNGEAGLYGVSFAEIQSGDGAGANYENNVSRTIANVYGGTYKVEHLLDSTKFTITSKVGAADKTELKINFDKSSTSHSFRPYDKYGLANETPVTGSGLKQQMTWTAGTPAFEYVKKDTTIYIDDADYDWSAAITTAQIASRFNRVIFWMTTTAAAGSDSELTLHTPDANLMQVEYLIHSVDEPAGFDNKIVFGTNNAVDSTNGLVTNYFPSAGDGIHIRAGLRSGVYKYRYSN